MTQAKNAVVAIGLDSAEPSVLEEWMEAGHLPHLSALRQRGAYGRLENSRIYCAETPWTTFASGCNPRTVGYWSPLSFDVENYAIEKRAAYDFEEFPPFYALGDDYRVAAFDLPQVPIHPDVNGLQVSAWGAHSPQVPSGSSPAGLYQELVERFGEHPGLHKDYAVCTDMASTMILPPVLETGIARRAQIMRHLLEQERWDLALTVFGEAHAAGHNFWNLSRPDHPLHAAHSPQGGGDRMLACFQQMDTAIGQILESAPDDAYFMVFSAHGMGPNTMDLPSGVFLPELMHRYSFDGKKALLGDYDEQTLPPTTESLGRRAWEQHIWASQADQPGWKRWLRETLPTRAYRQVSGWIDGPVDGGGGLRSPFVIRDTVREVPFQPTQWYAPLWSQMKAFALPTFSDGYVRLNVKGREPEGVVEAEAFNRVCEEVIEVLRGLRCARTGTPMVLEVEQVRREPHGGSEQAPPADIVIVWQEEFATDAVVSDRYGVIGPAPHYRAGSHRPEGFVTCIGEGIEPGARLEVGQAVDLAPTILGLMGAEVPSYLEGKALVTPRQRS